MNNSRCLTENQVLQLIDWIENHRKFDDGFDNIIGNSLSYEFEIGLLNYFLSIALLNRAKHSEANIKQLVEEVYKLPERMLIDIQEIDSNFIEFLMKIRPDTSLSIEEELILTYSDFKEFNYERQIRC